tara:strand:- start:42 stop:329 length:288 start_codon:yes stop_codon:yes gene_type:complete
MSIDKKIVSNVADLAKLKLNDSDLETISKELSNVLTWIESLNEVDTSSVEPIANIIGQKLSFREDEVTDGNYQEKILKNAPEKSSGFFVVPKVVE